MKPCPYCGALYKATRTGFAHPISYETGDRRCPNSGHHVGKQIFERYNMRPAIVFYTVESGLPVFNTDGDGKPLNVDKLQEFFSYVLKQGQ